MTDREPLPDQFGVIMIHALGALIDASKGKPIEPCKAATRVAVLEAFLLGEKIGHVDEDPTPTDRDIALAQATAAIMAMDKGATFDETAIRIRDAIFEACRAGQQITLDQYLTTTDVARELGITRSRVHQLGRDLKVATVGQSQGARMNLFTRDDVEKLRQRPQPKLKAEKQATA